MKSVSSIFFSNFGSDFQTLVIASAATVELNFVKSDRTKESSVVFYVAAGAHQYLLSHTQPQEESLVEWIRFDRLLSGIFVRALVCIVFRYSLSRRFGSAHRALVAQVVERARVGTVWMRANETGIRFNAKRNIFSLEFFSLLRCLRSSIQFKFAGSHKRDHSSLEHPSAVPLRFINNTQSTCRVFATFLQSHRFKCMIRLDEDDGEQSRAGWIPVE